MSAAAEVLALLSEAAGGDSTATFSPGGVYPVDTVFKALGYHAAGIFWAMLFPLLGPAVILLTAIARGIKGAREGTLAATLGEYLLWLPLLLFLLWPVRPSAIMPALGADDEEEAALVELNENLFCAGASTQAQCDTAGVPRIMLWCATIADTFLNSMLVKVHSLSTMDLTESERLWLSVSAAVPTDADVVTLTTLYWGACYEPAATGAYLDDPQATPPPLFGEDLEFPVYGEDTWEELQERLDIGGWFSDPAGQGCDDLRQTLVSEYGEMISDYPHAGLLEDLRRIGVSVSDEDYIEHIARNAVGLRGEAVAGLRSVISSDADLYHVDYIPVSRGDGGGFFTRARRAVGSAINTGLNWFTDFTTGISTRLSLPSKAKSAAEVFKMLHPSLFGASMLLVMVTFPFVGLGMLSGKWTVFLWWLKLYLLVATWPLVWALLQAYQYFFVRGEWGSLGEFMGDAATYVNVAIPFMLAASPALAGYIVHAAFASFTAPKESVVAPSPQGVDAAGGAKGARAGLEAGYAAGKDAAKGADSSAKGAGVGAAAGAVRGFLAGGAIGAAAGALAGGVRGAMGAGAKGVATGQAGADAGADPAVARVKQWLVEQGGRHSPEGIEPTHTRGARGSVQG